MDGIPQQFAYLNQLTKVYSQTRSKSWNGDRENVEKAPLDQIPVSLCDELFLGAGNEKWGWLIATFMGAVTFSIGTTYAACTTKQGKYMEAAEKLSLHKIDYSQAPALLELDQVELDLFIKIMENLEDSIPEILHNLTHPGEYTRMSQRSNYRLVGEDGQQPRVTVFEQDEFDIINENGITYWEHMTSPPANCPPGWRQERIQIPLITLGPLLSFCKYAGMLKLAEVSKNMPWTSRTGYSHQRGLTNVQKQWHAQSRIPEVSLNLNGQDASGADLMNADITLWKLDNANLSNSNLSGANMRYKNISHAKLNNTDLRNTDLTGAELTKVELEGAQFNGAILKDTTIKLKLPDSLRSITWADYQEQSRLGTPGNLLTMIDSIDNDYEALKDSLRQQVNGVCKRS